MPPRRSSRAASAKPPSGPVTVTTQPKNTAKTVPAPRSRAKRAASPEDAAPPPPKRTRNAAPKPDNNGSLKPSNGRARSVPAAVKKPTAARKHRALTPLPEVLPQMKPYFNPLPTPPEPHLRPAPQLFVWGAGNFGQFGMGPDVLGEFGKPRKNAWVEEQMQKGSFGEAGAGIEAIAAGGLHTMFIDEKGTIWSCGVNDDAALGRITKDVPDPKKPGSYLDIDDLTAVPHPLETLVAEGFRAVKVTAGDSISAAISAEGELRVWGSFRANEGALGFRSGLKHQFLPTSILELQHKPGDYEKAVDFASGNNHLLVLTTHGNVFCWGSGEQGQLGHKIMERRKIGGTVPYKVTLGSRSRKAVVVGAGNYHSFAVDDQGDVWAWGLNSQGQLGTGLSSTTTMDAEVQTPKKVKGLSQLELDGDKIVQISGGEHHTVFLSAAGKVYACGRCDGGQLGLPEDHAALEHEDGEEEVKYVTKPTLVAFPDDDDDPVVHVSAGTHTNMAVTKGGALYAWGEATQGELGIGEDGEARTPTTIVRKSGGSWAAIGVACGGQHTLGLFRKKN